MKKLLPLILPIIGIGAGVGAGIFLQPDPPPAAEEYAMEHKAEAHETDVHEDVSEHDAEGDPQYVKLNNQFVVPIIEQGTVTSIVVLSLSLELMSGNPEDVYAKEPKLRDGFLQILFDHSNMGGFSGAFTSASKTDTLRRGMLSFARKTVGPGVAGVLITDLARQDV
ncbi:flagellar basal body-associated FliL family protein [Thalassobius sp. S69A]|uniref:flagellar basal body-associated FliL family protein n=1 Tax=unclassified Thalassovita TaxID=2619711 RepID=UPI003C7EA3DB